MAEDFAESHPIVQGQMFQERVEPFDHQFLRGQIPVRGQAPAEVAHHSGEGFRNRLVEEAAVLEIDQTVAFRVVDQNSWTPLYHAAFSGLCVFFIFFDLCFCVILMNIKC